MIFPWSVGDSKSPQGCRTLFSILANLNNDVVWIVLIRPPISNSSSLLSNPLGSIPSAPITVGITVTFMFHSYLISPARSFTFYFSLPSFSLIFYSVGRWDGKIHNTASLFLFLFFDFVFVFCYHEVWAPGWGQVIRLYLRIIIIILFSVSFSHQR